MKDDQVFEHSLAALKSLIIPEAKHKSINCTLLIELKIKNKAVRFVQNYAVEIVKSYHNHNKLIVFTNNFDEIDSKTIGEDVIMLNGFEMNEKMIKKSYKWCFVDKEVSNKLDKKKAIVNKKSLLPNNYDLLSEKTILEQMSMVYSGTLIKATQVNNYISFKCGDIEKNNVEEINQNIEKVYRYFRFNLGYLIRRIYINQTMQKSKTICIRN